MPWNQTHTHTLAHVFRANISYAVRKKGSKIYMFKGIHV